MPRLRHVLEKPVHLPTGLELRHHLGLHNVKRFLGERAAIIEISPNHENWLRGAEVVDLSPTGFLGTGERAREGARRKCDAGS